ncbi:MAG TPA: S24 family peptidase [Azospirillaceae bacterium]|nr:S24 family peptidase [Azospirillaceae bacterium]
MMDSARQLIAARIDALGLSMAEVSRRIGRNHAYVQQYLERGVPKRLPEDMRHAIARFLDIPEEALRPPLLVLEPAPPLSLPAPGGGHGTLDSGFAEGAAPRPTEIAGRPLDIPAISQMARDVPVRGTAVGGLDADFFFNGGTVDWVRRPPGLQATRDAFAIYVAGSSMSPRYEEGDLVYVHPARPPRSGDDVLIELHGRDGEPGPCYIKRLLRRTPTLIVAAQFNPARDDLEYELASVRGVFKIMTAAELLGV